VEFVLILAILVVVALFVSVPLRRSTGAGTSDIEDPRRADLEARKEAKYREIRDAEVDRATGKLSEEEWRRQDVELRREAIAILKRIDELEAEGAGRGS
jgi:hypothetical protein